MTTVHLRRIDATRNMARFYALSIEANLFDGIVLVRRWGRMGTGGRSRQDVFESRHEAERAFVEIEGRKRRRGYGDVVSSCEPQVCTVSTS